jgi:hypothetical protein
MERGSECGRCSKRSWGAWAGDVAGDLGVHARVHACCPRRGTGKAELTGRSHGAARGSGRTEGTTQCADEAGPRGRDRKRACERGQPVSTTRPHWAERGRESTGKETATDRWHPPVRRRGCAAWLGRAGPIGLLWLFLFP